MNTEKKYLITLIYRLIDANLFLLQRYSLLVHSPVCLIYYSLLVQTFMYILASYSRTKVLKVSCEKLLYRVLRRVQSECLKALLKF